MIEVKQFKKEDLVYTETSGPEIDKVTPGVIDALHNHPAITVFKGGKPLAYMGIVVKDDTGIVWLLPTKDMYYNVLGVAKVVREQLDNLPMIYNLKRYVTNGCGDGKVDRWLTWLGFKQVNNELYERIV